MLSFIKKNEGTNKWSTRASALLSASISGINVPFFRKMEEALCVWPKNEGEVVLRLNKMYKDKEEMQSKSLHQVYYLYILFSAS